MNRRSRNPFVPACQGPQQTYVVSSSEISENSCFHLTFEVRKWKLSDSWVYHPREKILVTWSTYKQTSDLRWHEYNWLQNSSPDLTKWDVLRE